MQTNNLTGSGPLADRLERLSPVFKLISKSVAELESHRKKILDELAAEFRKYTDGHIFYVNDRQHEVIRAIAGLTKDFTELRIYYLVKDLYSGYEMYLTEAAIDKLKIDPYRNDL